MGEVDRAIDALVMAKEPLERVKSLYVMAVLRAAGGNKTAAAKSLGVSRQLLYRWLDDEKIQGQR